VDLVLAPRPQPHKLLATRQTPAQHARVLGSPVVVEVGVEYPRIRKSKARGVEACKFRPYARAEPASRRCDMHPN
jgi:hypothetical protein